MIIIDGHNLLHSIVKRSEEFETLSDVQLCRVLSKFLKLTGENGEIIFDGTGPRDKSGFDNLPNLEVFFAGLGTDADTVIEEKIKLSTAPKLLMIVSSDRRLKDAGRRRKATVIKSEDFWEQVQKQIKKKRKINKEPPGKRGGITEAETNQWLRFFGLE